MRAFFALELPAAAREALAQAARDLREAAPEAAVRWVGADAYHLTLRFLGELHDPAPARAEVAAALRGLPALRLGLGPLGSFGGRSPRVVWAAIEGQGLAQVAAAVEAGCRQAGFPPEPRPFRAHVTLGRVRRGRGGQGSRALARAIEASAIPTVEPFMVRQVVLFESVLEHGQPPVYEPVAHLSLGEPGRQDGDETR